MRTIPRRTDPLTRATMPAITSTAAITHKMVSVLPPPFAASIPRAPNMPPPFILWQQYRGVSGGAKRAPLGRQHSEGDRGSDKLRADGPVAPRSVSSSTAGWDAPLIGDLAKVLENLGVYAPRLRIWSAVKVGVSACSDLDGVGLLPLPPALRASPDRLRAHPPGLRGVGDRTRWQGSGAFRDEGASVPQSGDDRRPGRAPPARVLVRARADVPALDPAPPAEGATSWDDAGTTTDPVPSGRPGRAAAGILVAAATAHRVQPARSAARIARSRSELAKK
jgi:hypothetical protein